MLEKFYIAICVVKLITTKSTKPYFILALFRRVSSVHFQALKIKNISYKDCNNQMITRDNGNVRSHDQEDSKLNSNINADSGAHTLTHD